MRNYTLNQSQLLQIQHAIKKDTRPNVQKRAQVIYSLHLGDSIKQIADRLLLTRKTIYNWHDRWLANGVDGLADKAKSGRPKKATTEYRQLLCKLIAEKPAHYGYQFAIWTNQRMRTHLARETGIQLSERAFGNLLKSEGYVYRRPKKDLSHLQEAKGIRQAKRNLNDLKKGHNQENWNLSLWTRQQSD